MQKIMLNNDWRFGTWNDQCRTVYDATLTPVRLPHTVQQVPLHHADPSMYEGVFAYIRRLRIRREEGMSYILHVEGAAHQAEVYLNGTLVGSHHCGYTAFAIDLSRTILDGDNLLSIRLDTREDPSIPPFGFVIDYLCYGGLYRDVWLEVCPACHVEDTFILADMYRHIRVELTCTKGDPQPLSLAVMDPDTNRCLALHEDESGSGVPEFNVPDAELWSPDHPKLYTLKVMYGDDVRSYTFGFRSIRLGACRENVNDDWIYINEEKTFLRGLNRHQSYPYVGYAMPSSMQVEDARILKNELHVNTVRTSHYPQAQSFIDACDRLGLLVFTEIPGWQHIGNQSWKQIAMTNTEEMVKQYRNHPSIILWGVRINESQDDDDFYAVTNRIAHSLDPSRPTSGVRYLQNSHLLEDVYAFNDFSYNGTGKGALSKKEVTKEEAPLLISECNGHMFPTKSWDDALHRQEHALRHARVLDAAMKDHTHIGCIAWCMFDYATHKDFGSGDRICYHGVLDSFRNPKLAAAVYASQQEEEPVLEISSSMNIGDYPAGYIGDFYAFTNADEVKLYRNDDFVKSFYPDPSAGLKHPPIRIDDTIGHLLEEKEGMDPSVAKDVVACLLAFQKYGMDRLPLSIKAKAAKLMAVNHMTMKEAARLYGIYAGGWGSDAIIWRFDAIRNGKVVKQVKKGPGHQLHLEVTCSSSHLIEGDTYDVSALRIQIKDEYGTVASYCQLPVTVTVVNPNVLEVIGPSIFTAEGGMCGSYLKTTGVSGSTAVIVRASGLESVTVNMEVTKEN
ncbi:glycoside hydrolase family 2 TIM barrel-domain containing protein [Galactobacillus timonensis]|uniref:glycoside hydrolase family 2 protein n=1 Tax=Galactobacillus timonensis TaxID=2041840 RepID=UPI0023F57434|nr:glycoside hydrolase family 2 TIM barrel-domain containing protein [Galactobacillus timonensis]MCI6753751.1 glycoside hydrolase family 2 protein [Galactobacillus timonensis]